MNSAKTKSVKKTSGKKASVEAPASTVSPGNTFQVHALSAKAINLRLSTRAFVGYGRDTKLTDEVQKKNHTEDKRLSVVKRVMQGPELSKVSTALQKVRKLFESKTAPWMDGGIRIVPASRYVAVKLEIEELKREFYSAVDAFIGDYQKIIDRDKVALNGTFDISDYLSPDALRARFEVRIEPMPIPSDFRVEGIDDSLRAEMQETVNKLTEERVKEAKRDIISRVLERVKHLAARVNSTSEEERFNKAAISSVINICDEVSNVLFDGDAEISRIVSEVKTSLATLNADTIRDTDAGRKEASEKVSAELAKVTELMRAFA